MTASSGLESPTESFDSLSGRPTYGDRIFRGLSLAAGVSISVTLAAVFIFLAIRGAAGFHAARSLYAPYTSFVPYAAGLLFGTVLIALLALLIATPFAIGVALFLTHYAPKRIAAPIAYMVDLLAAVPSVVFGLWGLFALNPALKPSEAWLNSHLGWIPFFGGELAASGKTVLLASVVLAIMILPITTAIIREIFKQTPRLHEEAALALGATRWETIRYAVLPHARSGIIAGTMLGLGRALGETMAVLIVLNAEGPKITFRFLTENNPATIASNIAQKFYQNNTDIQVVLLATGLILFVFTFAVNFAARWIVARSEKKFR